MNAILKITLKFFAQRSMLALAEVIEDIGYFNIVYLAA
jgi:hypothetical protein